jgi:hypothetical protein
MVVFGYRRFLCVGRLGSRSRSIDKTFQAKFEMCQKSPAISLVKAGKRHYRNPIFLARERRQAFDDGRYASPSAFARHLKVSRARVTQIMNLLQLSPEATKMISSLVDALESPTVAERRLRSLLGMVAERQVKEIGTLLSSG